MIKGILNLILVLALSGATYLIYDNYVTTPCAETLSYSIGAVDQRFGISATTLAKVAQETETVWETPFTKEFFKYDQNAKFKINLVFDDRQQRTIDEQKTRTQIDSKQETYRIQAAEYNQLLLDHAQMNAQYESDLAVYNTRLTKYNQEVDYYNRNGGAPAKDFSRLQREKSDLQKESNRLEGIRETLNQKVAILNDMGNTINTMAQQLNLDVDAYNGKFGTSREFDQGSYTGSEINIYQFSGQDDLKLVLAHEFGHALDLDHIDDPEAIMYYLMDRQNIKNLHITQGDMDALSKSCGID